MGVEFGLSEKTGGCKGSRLEMRKSCQCISIQKKIALWREILGMCVAALPQPMIPH